MITLPQKDLGKALGGGLFKGALTGVLFAPGMGKNLVIRDWVRHFSKEGYTIAISNPMGAPKLRIYDEFQRTPGVDLLGEPDYTRIHHDVFILDEFKPDHYNLPLAIHHAFKFSSVGILITNSPIHELFFACENVLTLEPKKCLGIMVTQAKRGRSGDWFSMHVEKPGASEDPHRGMIQNPITKEWSWL